MNRFARLAFCFALVFPVAVLAEELHLPAMFADRMILQRDVAVPVWGWCAAGTRVTVTFAEKSQTAVADTTGKWSLKLEPLSASREPRTLTVAAADERHEIQDVLVGDVWLCSGQSNMAMTIDGKTGWLHIGGVAQAKDVVRDSANPLLRQFQVDWKTDTQPQAHCTGRWSIAGPDATANFSATGYFFARELQQRLQIPIGIVNASFGGSSVEGWTSREALARNADAEFVGQMHQLIDNYEHHDRLVANYVATVADWEAKHQRVDPTTPAREQQLLSATNEPAEWQTVTLPAPLAKLGCPEGGVVWLRRELDVPTEFGVAWRLDFPACRAFSAVYLNGTKIYEATPANGLAAAASRPTFAKGVGRAGRNTLTIKLQAYSGKSGITSGAFAVVPFNPKYPSVPLAGPWSCHVAAAFAPLAATAAAPPVPPKKGTLHWMPVPSQYNAMLHPLIPFAIRGVAWYQGESNVGNPRYARHLQILVNDWRARWGQGDMPFYVCQLPGFGPRKSTPADSRWAECREMQTAVLALPNTGLVNLIDTCEDGDLHPLNKRDVGQRLALVALANHYGQRDVVDRGPMFQAMSISADKVTLTFRHAEGGLVARRLPETIHPNLRQPELPRQPLELPSPESELQGFTICDASQRWVNAHAKIEGATVVVWSPEVSQPVAVRYAWADHPVCNLYNRVGLPAFPFRTDTFALPSVQKR